MNKFLYGRCKLCKGRLIRHQWEELYEYDTDGNEIYRLITEYDCSVCSQSYDDSKNLIATD